jgi:uncharacterized membrane protein
MTTAIDRRVAAVPRIRSLSARRIALPTMIVVTVAIVGSVWWAYLAMRRADGLATAAFDQAYFQQLVWSIGHGRGFTSSFNPGNFLGLHFSPLLLVPAALELAWTDARLLSLLQVVALGAAVPAAYLFVRELLRPHPRAAWVAAALAAPMISWPIMQQQLRADFHTEALALPFLFLAGWAGLTRRTGLLYLAVIVALTAKEDQVYPVVVMGLVITARAAGPLLGGARRHGLLVIGLAVGWALIVFGFIKPILRAGVTYDTDRYYAWLGQGLDVLRAPFTQTDAVVSALTRPAGWLVVLWLLVAMGGLAILRPRWLLLLVPPVVAHLLSRQIPQQQIALQYGLLLIVPGLAASALGARRLLAWTARRRRSRGPAGAPGTRRRWVRVPVAVVGVAMLAGLSVVAAYGGGAVPPFSRVESGFWTRPSTIDRARAMAELVPMDATLAVDWGLASAVAARPRIEVLTGLTDDAYLLLDRNPYVTGYFRWVDRPALLLGLPASGRRLIMDDGRYMLWGPVDG